MMWKGEQPSSRRSRPSSTRQEISRKLVHNSFCFSCSESFRWEDERASCHIITCFMTPQPFDSRNNRAWRRKSLRGNSHKHVDTLKTFHHLNGSFLNVSGYDFKLETKMLASSLPFTAKGRLRSKAFPHRDSDLRR